METNSTIYIYIYKYAIVKIDLVVPLQKFHKKTGMRKTLQNSAAIILFKQYCGDTFWKWTKP